MSLFDACVDLNPHQIEAALFALRSPLAKGVLFADEVGLGKTIEAALVLCQCWAERKRRLLVVCPASIRKQWALELEEKFSLPSIVLDSRAFRDKQAEGHGNPFENEGVVICSVHFASRHEHLVRGVPWNLVVIDEAHKLRNAYRPSNQMGRRIRDALDGSRKLLLTATPLQNSLLELYGLSTLIDERMFGDLASFRTQYMRQDGDLPGLRDRLRYFCKRTLRNQVSEYIRYTERRPFTVPFRPTDDEHRLYEAISEFLLRDDTYAIPTRQRTLVTLILRKLLASSSRAIAGTLVSIRERLEARLRGDADDEDWVEELVRGEDLEEDLLDELDHEEQEAEAESGEQAVDRAAIASEIAELGALAGWASAIGVDTKSRALLQALETGFREMAQVGAARKALVFTESRRTQTYLRDFLEANGFAGKVVCYSGTNSGPATTAIYETWVERNRDTGRCSGSRAVDVRTALIEHFRDHAEVMVATEAAAEGVNLQFCSLVINYDLPWNPQRVEQRIGRCHRYGQKHDVVVVNFLNQRNEADRRVLELLSEKFSLFSGVFGVSDDVLGTIESGVDFERRILDIYQSCRTPEQIETAFAALQAEMDASIQARLSETRQILLEHFDEDVHARLKVRLDDTREQLDQVGKSFWTVTRYMLQDHARFDDRELCFDLHTPPNPGFQRGRYHLISKGRTELPSAFLYRLSHPLGEHVVDAAKSLPTPTATVTFDLSGHPTRLAAVEALKGRAGWLTLQRLVIQSFEPEEYLLFSAFDDRGRALDQETCERLFRCAGRVDPAEPSADGALDRLSADAERHAQATISASLEANNRYFQEERDRLERWADDLIVAAEKDLAETKAQIKAARRLTRQTTTVEEQHAAQEQLRDLERKQRRQRQAIFDVEDEIAERRDRLIDELERQICQDTTVETLFTIAWSVA